jgi:hypothetical protein
MPAIIVSTVVPSRNERASDKTLTLFADGQAVEVPVF